MIPDQVLDMLYCSLSHLTKHFIENPIALACGHCACRKCILKIPQPIICGECGSKNRVDLNKAKESNVFKVSFESYFTELFQIILDNLHVNFDELKCEMKIVNERIDEQVMLIQDEISIRIETIKAHLNNLKDDLFNELDEKKEEMKSRMLKIEIESVDQDLEHLKTEIEIKTNLTQKIFYEYQDKLKYLNGLVHEFKYFDAKKLYFSKSDIYIEKELVGEINLDFRGKLLSRIKTKPKKIYEFDFNPCSLLELSNDYLLCCDNNNKRLVLFNEQFEQVKAIDRINNQPFTSLGIATDNDDRIFISDYQNHKVYATDLNFEHIKTFGDRPGNDNNSLLHPYDVFFYENFLYVCDCRNLRIQKLNSDLDYEASYELNYQPWQIKITNNHACVRANNSVLYFYELPVFSLKWKYAEHDGPICVYNSFFYEYSEKNKKIFCYDRQGKLDEDAALDLGRDSLHTSYRISIFNEQFVVSAQRKFIVI